VSNSQRRSDSAFKRARVAVNLRKAGLPDQTVQLFAKEVVTELVTRLHPFHDPAAAPTEDEIEALCHALIDDDETRAPEIIRRARREGVPLDLIYLGLLANAARTLGEWWEDDRVSFLMVSVAAGRVFGIMRSLRHEIANARSLQPVEKHALFATVAGETHTIGVTMAADMFRSRGWRIELHTGLEHDELVEAASRLPHEIIGLSAGHPNALVSLARLIVALRVTHPQAHILVSGGIIAHVPDLNTLIHADSVIGSAQAAMSFLDQLSDPASGE